MVPTVTDDAAVPAAEPGTTGATAAERAVRAFELVESWMFSEPMARLLAAFGGRLPTAGEPVGPLPDQELPDWLSPILDDGDQVVRGLTTAQTDLLRRALAVEQTASAEFDFRARGGGQYRERSQAPAADFDDGLRSLVLALADQLGLVSPQPTRFDRYAMTLVLGGGYRSPLLRSRYAAKLQAQGVSLGELSFLGSPRFLIDEPAERPAADEYAPGATDEFDLMSGAAQAEFGLAPTEVAFLCGCPRADRICPAWRFADTEEAGQTPPSYTHERQVDLVDRTGRVGGIVLSASTSRPPYRPDTADTFALWARHYDPQPGQRVLVVTTQVFVPFQSFEGIRRLYLVPGLEVDTVGFGSEWDDRPRTAEYLLQEVLSAIRSGCRLLIGAAELLVTGTVTSD